MIGIIGAMEEEVAALKDDMEVQETIEQASMVFCKGTLCGKEVVVVRSGIGKVNAGICAQILVDRFQVDTLINTGIAGSLDAKIDIGDMVISTYALHHDMDAAAGAVMQEEGFRRSRRPGVEPLGLGNTPLGGIEVVSDGQLSGIQPVQINRAEGRAALVPGHMEPAPA